MAYGDNIINAAESAIARARVIATQPFAWLTLTERASLEVAAQKAEDALYGKGTNLEYVAGWRTCARWAGTPTWYAKARYSRGICYRWGKQLELTLGELALVVNQLQPVGSEDAEVIASTTDQITTAREEAKKATELPDDDPGIPTWVKVTLGLAVVGGATWLIRPWGKALSTGLEMRQQQQLGSGQADWDDGYLEDW